jgi:hypothetical protein
MLPQATRSRRTEQLQRIITSAAAVDVADAVLASEDELLSGLEGPVLVRGLLLSSAAALHGPALHDQ